MDKYIIVWVQEREEFYVWEVFNNLEEHVREKIQQGYIPIGSPQRYIYKGTSGYYQAMFLKGE